MHPGTIFRKMGLPLWTFVGVGFSAIWFSSIGAILEKWLRNRLGVDETTRGLWSYGPQALMIAVPFLLVILIWIFQRSRRAIGGFSATAGLSNPNGKEGLILLISKPEHAMFAIRYHFVKKGTLKHVWLIPSHDLEQARFGQGTRAVAEQIKRECESLATSENRSLTIRIDPRGVSPSDSQDTFDCVNRIFKNNKAESLIADFTGGNKPMTVGMIMACLPRQRELEYVALNSKGQSEGPFLIDYQHSVFGLIG